MSFDFSFAGLFTMLGQAVYETAIRLIDLLPTGTLPETITTGIQYVFNLGMAFNEFLPISESLRIIALSIGFHITIAIVRFIRWAVPFTG